MITIANISDLGHFLDNIESYSHDDIIQIIRDIPLLYTQLPDKYRKHPDIVCAALDKNPLIWTAWRLEDKSDEVFDMVIDRYPILLQYMSSTYLVRPESIEKYVHSYSLLDLPLYYPSLVTHHNLIIPLLIQEIDRSPERINNYIARIPKTFWNSQGCLLGYTLEKLLLNKLHLYDDWAVLLKQFYTGIHKELNRDGHPGLCAWRSFWVKSNPKTYARLLQSNPILNISLDPDMEPITTWGIDMVKPFIQEYIQPLDALYQELALYID